MPISVLNRLGYFAITIINVDYIAVNLLTDKIPRYHL